MKKISHLEAYKAMYIFLEEKYNLTQSEELGGLLGSMSLLSDGDTADPAQWLDWLNALEKVNESDIDLVLKR